MINCIILDDEEHAIELLKLHIEQTPFLKLVGATTDPIIALQLLNDLDVGLLFLDIQMPGMTGLEFMTTAFREYALEGFEQNVVDYLLKPIIFSRFFKAAQSAQDIILAPGKDAGDFLLVKTEYKGKLIKIKTDDIIYIEGMKKYVRFHIRDSGPVIALLNIGSLEDKLPKDRFARIHKSFIIAIPFITMINGNMVLLEFTKENIPVGQVYRDAFMANMREKVITNKTVDPDSD